MDDCAELELGIYRAEGSRYALRCRFWQPGNVTESSLGLDSPAPVNFQLDELSASQAMPEEYGARLSSMLFADPSARSAFARARAVAEVLKVPLRLRLYIDPAAPELHGLRWETFVDPDRRTRICTDENILFSRFLSSGNLQSFQPSEVTRLRALALISNPSDMNPAKFTPLDLPAEIDRAARSLADMDMLMLPSAGKPTLDNLLDGLRGGGGWADAGAGRAAGCDILYLVAHGWTTANGSFILLEKPDGTGQMVSVDELINRISALRKLPLLAVLVSCQSAGSTAGTDGNVLLALGPRLAAIGIPAVIAMHGSVTFSTMVDFLPTFFCELQRDGQIDRALAVARGQVRGRPDWWMPVLFSRLADNQLLNPAPLAQPIARQLFEPETIFIPGGTFLMGRDGGDEVPAWEKPCHSVSLPSFRIGKYPVTNRQFEAFVRQTGLQVNPEAGWDGQTPPPDRLDYPMIGVTWYQAKAYCEWLSSKTGRSYALPSEAQWEKAARGTDGRIYPWGNEWQEERCNPNPALMTPVGQYPPQSPFGGCDMVGNVREWTASLWGERRSDPDYLYPWSEGERNSLDASELVRRVFRGGAAEKPLDMACSVRGGFVPDKSGPPGKRHGFRVVLLG